MLEFLADIPYYVWDEWSRMQFTIESVAFDFVIPLCVTIVTVCDGHSDCSSDKM